MKPRKLFTILLALVMLLLTACGGSSKGAVTQEYAAMDMAPMESPAAMEEMGYETQAASNSLTTSDTGSTALPESRKWIITMDMSVETEGLDAMLEELDSHILELKGYVEVQNVHNGSAYSTRRYRSASLTIRIPADQVDAFVANVADFSNIISSNQTVEDVTLNYVATESRVTALQTEEARLLELMESAETMSDLLEIEERLTEVRYELESVTSQLRTYDNLIDYATVYLEVSQVQELTEPEPESFWDRISSGFMESLARLWDFRVEVVIALIVSLPYILLIGIVVAVIVLLVKKGRKKRPADKAPSAQKDEPKE